MSYAAINWAMKTETSTALGKACLLVLAWHLNEQTGACYPSLRLLREETGIRSNTTLRAALDSLEKDRLIRRQVKKSERGRTLRTDYELLMTEAQRNGGRDSGNGGAGGSSTDGRTVETQSGECGTIAHPATEGTGQKGKGKTSPDPAQSAPENDVRGKAKPAPGPCSRPAVVPVPDPSGSETDTKRSEAGTEHGMNREGKGREERRNACSAEMRSTTPSPQGKAPAGKPKTAGPHPFTLQTIPDDWLQAAEMRHPDIDPMLAFEEFRSFWSRVPWGKGRKTDAEWLMAWLRQLDTPFVKRFRKRKTAPPEKENRGTDLDSIPFTREYYLSGEI